VTFYGLRFDRSPGTAANAASCREAFLSALADRETMPTCLLQKQAWKPASAAFATVALRMYAFLLPTMETNMEAAKEFGHAPAKLAVRNQPLRLRVAWIWRPRKTSG